MTNSQIMEQFIELKLTGRVQDDIIEDAKDRLELMKANDRLQLEVQTANESKLRQIQEYNEIQAGGL